MIKKREFRYMRLIVFFDIPIEPASSKKEYIKFRRFLLDNGYDMLQYSVYIRFCRNDTDANKHQKRLKKHAPKVGNVRVIKVTENQYENMLILIGDKTNQEKVIGSSSLIIID